MTLANGKLMSAELRAARRERHRILAMIDNKATAIEYAGPHYEKSAPLWALKAEIEALPLSADQERVKA